MKMKYLVDPEKDNYVKYYLDNPNFFIIVSVVLIYQDWAGFKWNYYWSRNASIKNYSYVEIDFVVNALNRKPFQICSVIFTELFYTQHFYALDMLKIWFWMFHLTWQTNHLFHFLIEKVTHRRYEYSISIRLSQKITAFSTCFHFYTSSAVPLHTRRFH